MTGSGRALSEVSGSMWGSSGLLGSRAAGGELLLGLSLRRGEREWLRFFSRLAGERLRGDGDLDFLLSHNKVNVEDTGLRYL